MTGFASAGGFAMPCDATPKRPDFRRFTRALAAAGFYQPRRGWRDPLTYRSEPLPLPASLVALPGGLTDPAGATHMRVTVQLWDDGGHRVSHEVGDGSLCWRGDTPPVKFATVGEMLAAIAFQPIHRRNVWSGVDDRSEAPNIRAELANRTGHHRDCHWQFEQYPWECNCGAVPDPASRRPSYLGAAA